MISWAIRILACAQADTPASRTDSSATTAEAARQFLSTVNDTMRRLGTSSNQAAWVYSTYITPDSEALNARANQAFIEAP